MFKRVIWMGAGFGAGLGSSFWVKRAVNRRVQRVLPPHVRHAVGRRARSAGSTVRSAVSEGRSVMRQYERDAEAEITAPQPVEGTVHLRAVPD